MFMHVITSAIFMSECKMSSATMSFQDEVDEAQRKELDKEKARIVSVCTMCSPINVVPSG